MPAPDHATHEGLTLTESDIERRKQYVSLEPDDLARLAAVRDVVLNSIDEYVSGFFDYLHRFEETATLFAERKALGGGDAAEARAPRCHGARLVLEEAERRGEVRALARLLKSSGEAVRLNRPSSLAVADLWLPAATRPLARACRARSEYLPPQAESR